MTKYSKAFAVVLATILSAAYAALGGDGVISNPEWVNIAILGVGAATVYITPNIPGYPYAKAVAAVLTAVLTVLTSAIIGGVTSTEWIQIIIAGLGAVGVYSAENK